MFHLFDCNVAAHVSQLAILNHVSLGRARTSHWVEEDLEKLEMEQKLLDAELQARQSAVTRASHHARLARWMGGCS